MKFVSDDQFAALWDTSASLGDAVERLCDAAGVRVPRWAIVARVLALRTAGRLLKAQPDEVTSAHPLARTRELAVALMAAHGLTAWEFGFNGNLRRAGVCRYPTRTRPGRIELSRHFVRRNPDAEVRDTILHEIAHALVGPGRGHDAVWRAKCLEIGARPERCYGEEIEMPKGRWRAVCPGCTKEYDRHRRPKALRGWHCRPCGRERGELVWRECG
ncbi:MAG TPA: SprT-like domain-containing protein [Gemmata sp.]|nr:SprT-like domain-containing protein [Gemmata sp.]